MREYFDGLASLAHGVNSKAAMNTSDSDPDDKVVVDTAELEVASRSSSHHARGEDGGGIVRAKGTREQVTMGPAATGTVRTRRIGELARDPAEVLRAWPHSMAAREARAAARVAGGTSPAKQRVEDKVTLAHLALDLYREVEQIQAGSRHAHGAHPAACTNHGCEVRIDALRGALVEAVLLVQRVAMSPTDRTDIEDRIQELLELLER